jgi:hypothetical protein
MASLRLKYVQGLVDRHGHPRFYFRRPGFARVTLPGSPWSKEFMEAYQQAMSLETAALKVGSEKVKPRLIHALAIAYYGVRLEIVEGAAVAKRLSQHYRAPRSAMPLARRLAWQWPLVSTPGKHARMLLTWASSTSLAKRMGLKY